MMTSGPDGARAVGLAALIWLAAACAPGPGSAVRFENRPPVWWVDDRAHTPERPRVYPRHRAQQLPFGAGGRARAQSVNAMDEVPDSTWFVNRIGARPLSVAAMARGPYDDPGPEPYRPWLVLSMRAAGADAGLTIVDRRGVHYLLRFDPPGLPELQTGAAVVVQRLLWACGYNVADSRVVYFRRSDLALATAAEAVDRRGRARPLTEADLDDRLALTELSGDGRVRALALRPVEGDWLGAHPGSGVREGDPNDVIPIERRREVRGSYPIFAWIDHVGVGRTSTLDTWVRDPRDPRVRYVRHYWVDFGAALGALAVTSRSRTAGFARRIDVRVALASLVTLGLHERSWEGAKAPALRGVGRFESERYDPAAWVARAGFAPHDAMDRQDAFWGARILMRLSPAHVRAAVEQGRYSDRRAVEYLTRVLIERQRKTALYWFEQVSPLDRFEIDEDADGATRLCFEDLTLAHDLSPGQVGATGYDAASFDFAGRRLGWRQAVGGRPDGRACVAGFPAGVSRDGYTIVRIAVRRGERRLPPVLVHLAREPAYGALRVIGIWRM